jgi:hypothetical protein
LGKPDIIKFILNSNELEEMIVNFLEKGGRINKIYLKNPLKGPVLVFYKRWYRGKNIRDGISRALAGR